MGADQKFGGADQKFGGGGLPKCLGGGSYGKYHISPYLRVYIIKNLGGLRPPPLSPLSVTGLGPRVDPKEGLKEGPKEGPRQGPKIDSK